MGCETCKGKKSIKNPDYDAALAKEIEYHEDKAPSFYLAEIWAKKSLNVSEYITCAECNGSGRGSK